jgi:circadian clock protein KaiC
MTENGVELIEVYLGPDGVLTGAARVARQARERAGVALRDRELERRRRALERRRAALDGQLAAMRDELDAETRELEEEIKGDLLRESVRASDRAEMARTRRVDLANATFLARNEVPTGKLS